MYRNQREKSSSAQCLNRIMHNVYRRKECDEPRAFSLRPPDPLTVQRSTGRASGSEQLSRNRQQESMILEKGRLACLADQRSRKENQGVDTQEGNHDKLHRPPNQT